MIWELRHKHNIALLINIAKIPRSTYYYYSKQFSKPKPDKYAEIKVEIRRIYDESKGYAPVPPENPEYRFVPWLSQIRGDSAGDPRDSGAKQAHRENM